MSEKNINESYQFLEKKLPAKPSTAIILGSGLGSLADELIDATTIKCSDIPHYPKPRVEGHAGVWVIGKLHNLNILALKGRVHTYEGYSAYQVTYPIQLLAKIGIKKLIVTNAAGGVNKSFSPGDLMIIKDHINMLFDNPLIGDHTLSPEEKFTDMSNAYDKKYIESALAVADSLGISVKTGVLLCSKGPTYETAAEVRMGQILNADAVTMSTVPEVITANMFKIRILGVSCITNMATGILNQKLSHDEVTKTANKSKAKFIQFMKEVLFRIDSW